MMHRVLWTMIGLVGGLVWMGFVIYMLEHGLEH